MWLWLKVEVEFKDIVLWFVVVGIGDMYLLSAFTCVLYYLVGLSTVLFSFVFYDTFVVIICAGARVLFGVWQFVCEFEQYMRVVVGEC